jgi:hypothetical protein
MSLFNTSFKNLDKCGVGEFFKQIPVIPAKAGIQRNEHLKSWMPAFAGMTVETPRPLI